MRKTIFWAAALFFCTKMTVAGSLPIAPYLPAQDSEETSNAPVTVQYPQENATVLRGAKNIYLFGKVHKPNATLNINGQDVPLYKNGTFIAFVPVEQGAFPLVLTVNSLGKTFQSVRNITVPGQPIKNFLHKALFDETEVYPSSPLWVLPGEIINLSVRGTPGAKVTAELQKLKGGKKVEMKESPRNPGLYTGKYLVRENEKPRQVKITYTIQDGRTKTKAKISAKERAKILNPSLPLPAAHIADPGVKLRQIAVHQGSLYPYYRAYGDVQINGRDNGLYRLQLGNGEQAWLEENKLELFSPVEYQPNVLDQLSMRTGSTLTQLRWTQQRPTTVALQEFNNRLEITFYDTLVFKDYFKFDTTSPLLERMEWLEPAEGLSKFILYFKPNQPLWGYGYRYEGNNFIVDLHHQPRLTPSKSKPLAGARIVIDAGHSPKRKPPYDGLVTPSGHLEYEETLALAELLQTKLKQAGATVIMTREGQNYMSLPDRYNKALEEEAHIFVSLHYNALPDTINPLAAPRGYSVYYTYPHSLKLAQSVYSAFNKQVPLPDNGLIANDVLFIPRIPEMPSILVENAFLIMPEQEDWVLNKKGRAILAQTLYQGILDFFRSVQSPAPKAKRR